jgi:hypothetical protein
MSSNCLCSFKLRIVIREQRTRSHGTGCNDQDEHEVLRWRSLSKRDGETSECVCCTSCSDQWSPQYNGHHPRQARASTISESQETRSPRRYAKVAPSAGSRSAASVPSQTIAQRSEPSTPKIGRAASETEIHLQERAPDTVAIKARRSASISSGSSSAAKCPPRGMSVQCTIL